MKKLLTILFAFALGLNLSAQVPNYVPTDGLVAWYSFNGNGEDSSNNGNDLIKIGDPSWGDVQGRPFVDLPGNGEHFYHPLDSFPVAEEFSIAMWVRIDVQHGSGNVGSVMPIASKHYSGAAGSFILYDNNGTIGGYSHGWELGEWHHLALTISSTSRNYYFDGALAGGIEDDSWSNTTYPFMIGGWLNQPWWSNNWSNSALSFDGGIGAVGVWGRVLTAAEVSTVFNESILGCTDSTACNFDSEATSDYGSCIPSGCMETEACNYNALAECEGEECDYNCCPGPGCCGEGMFWDYELEQCQIFETCQEDLDGDGVIGVNDLMQLLSLFGTDCEAEDVDPELGEFTCGDPINYHGYDYATVQIGEQCWFAENLRTTSYSDGFAIPGGLSDAEWSNTSAGAMAIYGEGSSECDDNQNTNSCDPDWSDAEYGRLYNWHAVNDSRALCPSGWHVPSDSDWISLELALGMDESEANSDGFRGDVGGLLKSTDGWWLGGPGGTPQEGSNSTGFTGLPGGIKNYNGLSDDAGVYGCWWTSSPSPNGEDAWNRQLYYYTHHIVRDSEGYWTNRNNGLSIRCLKDTE